MLNLRSAFKSISENEQLKDKVKEVVKEQVNEQLEFAKSTVKWYAYGVIAVIVLVVLILGAILYNIIF